MICLFLNVLPFRKSDANIKPIFSSAKKKINF